MIKGSQIRAARGLIDWSADQLARKVGLSRVAISKIEDGSAQPRALTIEAIVKAFADNQIEFTDRGVEWAHPIISTIEGDGCYLKLLDLIYQDLLNKRPTPEVLSICTDDAVSPPPVVQAITRWHDAGFKCRFLTRENATRFDFPRREYRLIPERFFTNSVMVVFDDRVATLSQHVNSVIIVRDANQASMLRGLFDMIWLQYPMRKGGR
jgi:transcriptional regulator with XRE-family HTH domain